MKTLKLYYLLTIELYYMLIGYYYISRYNENWQREEYWRLVDGEWVNLQCVKPYRFPIAWLLVQWLKPSQDKSIYLVSYEDVQFVKSIYP